MSDASRLEAVVLRSLVWHMPGMQADNRLTLTYLIVGLILGRNVQLSKMAERVNYGYKESSLEDRFRRLLANDQLEVAVSYSLFVGLILQSIDPQRVVLSIDTTKSGGACVTLMIGISYRSRSLPICWVTFKGKKGHTSQQVQLALLQAAARLLPADSQVILVGDGEFDGTQVIEWLVNQVHWHYVCRTAQDTQVYYQGQWLALQDLPLVAEQEVLIEVDQFTAAHHLPGCRIMAVWVAKEGRHWFFVTNFPSLAEAQRWYRKRFQIETLFADLKGRGFNLAQSHLKDPDRVNRLLLAVALAYLFIVFWGVEALRSGTFRTLVRTDRFDHSLTQLGFKYIYHQLKKLLPVPPLLRWPDPDSFCHIVLP